MSLPPPIPTEERRLASVRSLGLLDTPPERSFDRVAHLAQRLLDAPMAHVALVDARRLWCKSLVGHSLREVRRELALCSHTIAGRGAFMVPDTTLDERFRTNRLVVGEPHIRSYAAHPIAAPDGATVGTVAVLDRLPRPFGDEDGRVLAALARLAELELAAPRLRLQDPQTGLANRRGFAVRAEAVQAACLRRGVPLVLMLVDVEPPFVVLPSLGDDVPSAVPTVAGVLARTLRSSDLVGRLSGNRLAAVLVGARSADAAAERLAARIEAQYRTVSHDVPPRFHVASATSQPGRLRSVRELVGEATVRLQEVRATSAV